MTPTPEQIEQAEATGRLAARLVDLLMAAANDGMPWEEVVFSTGLAMKGFGEAVREIEGIEEREVIYGVMMKQVIQALSLPDQAVQLFKTPEGVKMPSTIIPVRTKDH